MSWKDFEEQAPELASLGYQKLHRKIAYLATLKKDGSPRLHPITPFIGNEMLFIFTEPSSPKIKDLIRDPRFALHCTVGDGGPLVEFLVSGIALVVEDVKVRAKAVMTADSPVVTEGYVLFNFHPQYVLTVAYDERGKPKVRRWRQG